MRGIMHKIRSSIRAIIDVTQVLLGILTGLTGFWILYSKLAIEHNAQLPPAVDAPQRLVPTRGGKINYYANETAGGRPLVLVHSVNTAASAFEMKPLFDFYCGKRPVYLVDLPGFGFSARDKRTYSPQLFANSLFDFLDQALDEPADVVALSLSCEFVARTAHMAPSVIHSIAMLSPTGFVFKMREIPAETLRNAKRRHSVMAFPLWRRALHDLMATRASIHWFLKRSFVGDPASELEEYDYATSHQPGADHVPLYFVSGMLFTPDVRTVLYERLEMPVLALYDVDGYMRFDSLAQHITKNANWHEHRIAPTLGLPHWEALAETTAALDEFWAITWAHHQDKENPEKR